MRSNEEIDTPEQDLISGIRNGDEKAFQKLFMKYYKQLCSVSAGYLNSYDIGREVVQEVFLSIWEQRAKWNPSGPLQAYLYRAVYNRSINYLKQHKRQNELMRSYHTAIDEESHSPKEEEQRELSEQVWEKVKELPKKRYLVFVLHRRQGLSYKEIAEYLNISIKTVENQMGQALKFLRDALTHPDIPNKS
ncbi:MAG: RNA polymerase sigma-70 factor [Balneolaceae bacterium]